MTELLDVNDPDYAAYRSGDAAFLLKAVGETIRNYCGWHISPSVTETIGKLPIGSDGILMVPSMHITDVASVTVFSHPGATGRELPDDSYLWHANGFIEPVGQASFWGASSYYYEPGPVFMPSDFRGYAEVVLTHGYAELPANVKWVAYELAGWTGGLGPDGAGGDVKQIRSPGFVLSLGPAVSLGMNLNPDQKARLANYKIGGVK